MLDLSNLFDSDICILVPTCLMAQFNKVDSKSAEYALSLYVVKFKCSHLIENKRCIHLGSKIGQIKRTYYLNKHVFLRRYFRLEKLAFCFSVGKA